MVLRDSFYTIVHSDISEKHAGFRLSLNPESFVYKAHFQNNPITPGVCLIQMAVELFGVTKSEDLTIKTDFTIKTLKNVKFIAPVSPLEFPEVDFTLEFTPLEPVPNETGDTGNPGGWQLKVVVGKNEMVFAKMSMVLI